MSHIQSPFGLRGGGGAEFGVEGHLAWHQGDVHSEAELLLESGVAVQHLRDECQ